MTDQDAKYLKKRWISAAIAQSAQPLAVALPWTRQAKLARRAKAALVRPPAPIRDIVTA